jgi:hypothetical protein
VCLKKVIVICATRCNVKKILRSAHTLQYYNKVMFLKKAIIICATRCNVKEILRSVHTLQYYNKVRCLTKVIIICATRCNVKEILRSAHTLNFYDICNGYCKEPRLFPCTTLTNWFLERRQSVFTARYVLLSLMCTSGYLLSLAGCCPRP